MVEHIINRVFDDISEDDEREFIKHLTSFLIYYKINKKNIDDEILNEKRRHIQKVSNKNTCIDLSLEIFNIDLFNYWINKILLPKKIKAQLKSIRVKKGCCTYIDIYYKDLMLLNDKIVGYKVKHKAIGADNTQKEELNKILSEKNISFDTVDIDYLTKGECDEMIKKYSSIE